jgi:predicted transcriptional regulator with HTH domain
VKTKDELIYDLIFSDVTSYRIDIAEYLDDIYGYEEFVAEIKRVLKKSKVNIVKSSVLVDSKTAIWELKVKK